MTREEAIKWLSDELVFLTRPNVNKGSGLEKKIAVCRMAIEALREQEERRWIPVTERLPVQPPDRVDEQGRSWFTPDIDCIVYDSENVFAAHYCFQNKCFWYADTLHPLKNITHWMYYPQPPKGE